MLNIIFMICLMVVAGSGYSAFKPVNEMDESRLEAIVNTIEMSRLFEREYDPYVMHVSGPKNYQELATVDRPMNGRIPINVYQDIQGSKDRYFSRWSGLSKEELQHKEFIFTGEGISAGSRALVLAAYWKEKYAQLTGESAKKHQIKVVTFNAGPFGDDIFQKTINRVIEKESILNFYIERWGDYIPFSSYIKHWRNYIPSCIERWGNYIPFPSCLKRRFADWSIFSRDIPYATSIPVSMVALGQENYQTIFKHLSVISFCAYVAKVAYSFNAYCTLKPGICSDGDVCGGLCEMHYEKSDLPYVVGVALPVMLLYSVWNCKQYLSNLVPSASVARKSLLKI